MCSASTTYSAIKSSGLKPGDWAVFPGGGGGVGIQGVQLAFAMGMRPIVVDTGDERRELAKKYGAEHFIDFKEESDPVKKVVELTEGGGHGVFVTGELNDGFHWEKSPSVNNRSAVQSYPIALGYLGHRAQAKVMW